MTEPIRVTHIRYRDPEKQPDQFRGYDTFQIGDGIFMFTWEGKEQVIIPIDLTSYCVSIVEDETEDEA